MNKYTATFLGKKTRQLMCDHEFKGKVLAVFSNIIYLASESDDVIWIITEPSFLHVRCIALTKCLPEIGRENTFHASDNSLEFNNNQSILFDQAETWEHRLLESTSISPLYQLKKNYQQLSNIILRSSNIKGFGYFIPMINRRFGNLTKQIDFEGDDLILKSAWPIVNDVIEACLHLDINKFLDRGEKLIGLGSGLTPSGDDFLGGIFFALNQLREYYPDQFHFNLENLSDFLIKVKEETNLISYTLFKDLFWGDAVEPLHQFMDTLLAGQPLENSMFHLNKFVQMGHSTGWDEISGVLCGLLVTLNF